MNTNENSKVTDKKSIRETKSVNGNKLVKSLKTDPSQIDKWYSEQRLEARKFIKSLVV